MIVSSGSMYRFLGRLWGELSENSGLTQKREEKGGIEKRKEGRKSHLARHPAGPDVAALVSVFVL